jgi:hypothetical protein
VTLRGVSEVEERAQRLLARVPEYVWDGSTLPVPVEDIADSVFGLLVRDEPDMTRAPGAPALAGGNALSGLLLPSTREIWVNAEEAVKWPGRRRFTISHELGHWCMHRHEHTAAIFCRSIMEAEDRQQRPERPVPEQEADEFAAALLMPAELLREQYEICRSDLPGEDCFPELCRRFGSSKAAMGRRLHRVI